MEGHLKFQEVGDFKCLNVLKDGVELKWESFFERVKGARGVEGYKPRTFNLVVWDIVNGLVVWVFSRMNTNFIVYASNRNTTQFSQ